MASDLKTALGGVTPELLNKFIANAEGRSRLAQAMIEPIRRRRYGGGPFGICSKCGKYHWEPEDSAAHSDEECTVYSVQEA